MEYKSNSLCFANDQIIVVEDYEDLEDTNRKLIEVYNKKKPVKNRIHVHRLTAKEKTRLH